MPSTIRHVLTISLVALSAGCLSRSKQPAGSGGDMGPGAPHLVPGEPSGPIADPNLADVVNALIPTYASTSIVSFSAQSEMLPMPMNHLSTAVPPGVFSSCSNCHVNIDANGVGVYYPGNLHSSLANLKLPEPTVCSDCHVTSQPTGFVGATATNPARTPPSGEMKHDAVTWENGAPTTTKLVTYDCSTCHTAPSRARDAIWTTGPVDGTAVQFHAAIGTAAQKQPSSCVDCHANSRPSTVLTPALAGSLPAGVTFDHGSSAAAGDCVGCHANGAAPQWTSWSGGQFHAAGSSTPSTCLPCHEGERPTSTSGWLSSTYTKSPFDYVTNAQGIKHGDGQDCATCHGGPGTGAWGGTQNWAGGKFAHGTSSVAGTTCIACHASQRPDLVLGASQATAALGGWDHAVDGTGDCFGCHQATVTAGSYVSFYAPGTTSTFPGGDWKGGVEYPGSVLIASSTQFIQVTELTLNRSGAYNLITSITSVMTTLYNAMLHTSAQVVAAGFTAPDPNNTTVPNPTCAQCHTVNGKTITFANGQFHSKAKTQPTSNCTDCHVNMRPAGVVEKAGSDLSAMDHAAQFTAAVTIGGKSVTGVGQIDCSTCHKSPGSTWGDGVFHASVNGATPKDCSACHYPLMADSTAADVKSGTSYAMKHQSAQVTFQACSTCHASALAAATGSTAATAWKPGAFHPSVTAQPTACVDCHAVSEPAANAATQSSYVYALAGGGTGSNGAQWMNHGSSYVAGRDCVACHAGDAKSSGSAWNKGVQFHAAVPTASTCQECHGLTNGGGATPGTSNNMPAGLTSSSTMTTAANDVTTGVAAGTLDQISHADVNVTGHDCNFCHSQIGLSSVAGVSGKEWAQARFHQSFTATTPLVINGSTGRCSNCHMNVKPGASFTAQDHSAFTGAAGSQDCSACHSWPGTGTAAAPNWLGASGVPPYINVGGFPVTKPPATTTTTQTGISNLPHPTVGSGAACTTCHKSASGGTPAIGYDHASTLINTNCGSCHEAGSNLVGTPWNGATAEASGAGDTRPYTLASVTSYRGGDSLRVSYANHFYPVDCYQCHVAAAGTITTSTGATYAPATGGSTSTSRWAFPHNERNMTNPSTCLMCHTNGVPN